MLPNECLELFIPAPPNPRAGNDLLAWFPIVNGNFTLKSAHNSWTDDDIMIRNNLYKNMWKVKTTQRIKAFMWLVMNDALLTNHACFRRGLVTNDLCALCSAFPKTTLHTLCDCVIAKELWKSVGNSLLRINFYDNLL